LHLQEFWVKNHGEPAATGVQYRGSEGARPERRVLSALREADRIVICPANPVTSILPILSVDGIRKALMGSDAERVAISPMIGESPISGPAAKLMRAIGSAPDSKSVASLYSGLIDKMLIDPGDESQAGEILSTGAEAVPAPILMNDFEGERRLARSVLGV